MASVSPLARPIRSMALDELADEVVYMPPGELYRLRNEYEEKLAKQTALRQARGRWRHTRCTHTSVTHTHAYVCDPLLSHRRREGAACAACSAYSYILHMTSARSQLAEDRLKEAARRGTEMVYTRPQNGAITTVLNKPSVRCGPCLSLSR